jgi:2'-5' RNA ligase
MIEQVINIQISKNKEIEKIRKKYLKSFNNIPAHVTLIYNFNKEKNKVREHVKSTLSEFRKFDITLEGIGKSKKDYFIYLLIGKGKDK